MLRKEHIPIFYLLYALFFILLLSILTYAVMHSQTVQMDKVIMSWFHTLHTVTLDNFFKILTQLGSLWLLLPLFTLLLLREGYRHHSKQIFWASSVFLFSLLTARIMKYLIGRERPDFFQSIIPLPTDPSFPSAHTAQAFSFVLALWLIFYASGHPLRTSLFLLLLLLAVLVALSRIYLQVHFPSDVAAGVLIALFWASVIFYFIQKDKK